ncbi:hypothetical protein [Mesomycoplasma ovipneumoniae]|uniref:hypothetical protein n=1 Tax=Mesomycoplasma ovipneumoniae TaxID=29562 RepID=UPI0028A65353|nr:hypothetical protein [Mesomycoplasma ovipneumoniae]WNM15365.1 hypothetical protein RNM01_01910 [Mesomycoplasma ovipneumoniae]
MSKSHEGLMYYFLTQDMNSIEYLYAQYAWASQFIQFTKIFNIAAKSYDNKLALKQDLNPHTEEIKTDSLKIKQKFSKGYLIMITINEEKFDTIFKEKLIKNLLENRRDKLIEYGKSENVNFLSGLEELELDYVTALYSEMLLGDDWAQLRLESMFLSATTKYTESLKMAGFENEVLVLFKGAFNSRSKDWKIWTNLRLFIAIKNFLNIFLGSMLVLLKKNNYLVKNFGKQQKINR